MNFRGNGSRKDVRRGRLASPPHAERAAHATWRAPPIVDEASTRASASLSLSGLCAIGRTCLVHPSSLSPIVRGIDTPTLVDSRSLPDKRRRRLCRRHICKGARCTLSSPIVTRWPIFSGASIDALYVLLTGFCRRDELEVHVFQCCFWLTRSIERLNACWLVCHL